MKQSFKNLMALQDLEVMPGFFFRASSSCRTTQGMTSTGFPMPAITTHEDGAKRTTILFSFYHFRQSKVPAIVKAKTFRLVLIR